MTTHSPCQTVILGRLKATPILSWLCLILGLGAYGLWTTIWGNGLEKSLYFRVLGNAIYPIFFGSVAIAIFSFIQMWRLRSNYLRHDGNWMHRGWRDKWPLSEIQKVHIQSNWMGLRSLHANIAGRNVELAKAYFLQEDVEQVAAKFEALAVR